MHHAGRKRTSGLSTLEATRVLVRISETCKQLGEAWRVSDGVEKAIQFKPWIAGEARLRRALQPGEARGGIAQLRECRAQAVCHVVIQISAAHDPSDACLRLVRQAAGGFDRRERGLRTGI